MKIEKLKEYECDQNDDDDDDDDDSVMMVFLAICNRPQYAVL